MICAGRQVDPAEASVAIRRRFPCRAKFLRLIDTKGACKAKPRDFFLRRARFLDDGVSDRRGLFGGRSLSRPMHGEG